MGNPEPKKKPIPGAFHDELDEAYNSEGSNTSSLARPQADAVVAERTQQENSLGSCPAPSETRSSEATDVTGVVTVENNDAPSIPDGLNPNDLRDFYSEAYRPERERLARELERKYPTKGPKVGSFQNQHATRDEPAAAQKGLTSTGSENKTSVSLFGTPMPTNPPTLSKNDFWAQVPAPLHSQHPAHFMGSPSSTWSAPNLAVEPKTLKFPEYKKGENIFSLANSGGSTSSSGHIPGLTNFNLHADKSTPLHSSAPQGDGKTPAISDSMKAQAKQYFSAKDPELSAQPIQHRLFPDGYKLPTTSLFGQDGPFSQSGLFGQSHNLFGPPKSPVTKASIPTNDHIPDANPPLKDQEPRPHDGVSATKESIIIETPDDLLRWAEEFLDFNDPFMATLKDDLKELHGSIASFAKHISQIAETTLSFKAAIRATRDKISTLQRRSPPTSIAKLEEEAQVVKDLEQHVMTLDVMMKEKESSADSLRSSFVKEVLQPLLTFSGRREKLEEKNKYVSDIRNRMYNLERELVTVRGTCGELDANLDAAENESAKQHAEHRKKMDNKIAEKDLEKEDALRAQKLKYKAQIEEAEATKLRHNRAMTKLDELQEVIQSSEREKTDLNLTKAVLEKELNDLEKQIGEWKSYKDGYDQIKRQYEELQVSYNDTVAERDELQEKFQELEAGQAKTSEEPTTAPSQVSSTIPRQFDGPHATESDHLDGLIAHWKNKLKVEMTSVEQKRAEIARYDSEIANLRGNHVAPSVPAPQPAQDSHLNSPPTSNTANFQFLDVGVLPLTGEGHLEIGASHQALGQVGPPQATPTPSQTWASRVGGQPSSTRGAFPPPTQTAEPRGNDQQNSDRKGQPKWSLVQDYERQDVVGNKRGRDKSTRK